MITAKLNEIYSDALNKHKFCTACGQSMITGFRRIPLTDAFAYIICVANYRGHDFKVVAMLQGDAFDPITGEPLEREWVEI